jgi:hypothetical protein
MFEGRFRSFYGATPEETPPDYQRLRRETKVNMRGQFLFDGVAPGRYIVATRVFWNEPFDARDPQTWTPKGGALYDVVDVENEKTTIAIISGQ